MEENLPEIIETSLPILKEYLPMIIDIGLDVLAALFLLIMGWVIGNWLKSKITSIKKMDNTLKSFLGGFVKYAVLSISFIIVLQQLGIQTASLIAVLGAAGLAIGFALQGTLSNVAAGVMLLVLRPFNVGDYIKVGNVSGTVKSLGLFGCELSTSENVYIYCPNGNIWNKDIQNFSTNKERRQDYIVSISYDDDIDKAMASVMSLVDNDDRVFKDVDGKAPFINVKSLGDFSVNLLLRLWCKSSDNFNLRADMTKAIKEKLDQDNISIPYPTSVVKSK